MSKVKRLRNATEYLEDGETAQASVLVRVGAIKQQNHALVATEEHLYAFRLRWPGFSKIAELLHKIPVDQATLIETPGKVRAVDGRGAEIGKWQKLPGRSPKALVEYVNGRGGRPADPPDAG